MYVDDIDNLFWRMLIVSSSQLCAATGKSSVDGGVYRSNNGSPHRRGLGSVRE